MVVVKTIDLRKLHLKTILNVITCSAVGGTLICVEMNQFTRLAPVMNRIIMDGQAAQLKLAPIINSIGNHAINI